MTSIRSIMVDGLKAPAGHFCHAVRAGDRLWISGMVGADVDGFVPDDVVEQFRIALRHVDTVLASEGGVPRNIVKVQIFLTSIADRARINPLREEYFGAHRPASTLVEVSALVAPSLKVEIEAEAVLDD